MTALAPQADFDIAIVGGGPVGLACAGWLASHWGKHAHRIAVFDAKPLEQATQDSRVLALSHATRLRLEGLGFPQQATPIHHIHVSEQGCFGQVRMSHTELGLPALGWTVRYGDLVQTLAHAVQKKGVTFFRPAHVQPANGQQGQFVPPPETLCLRDGSQYTTGLRIDAEGGQFGHSAQRDHSTDYQQWALVAEIDAHLETAFNHAGQTVAFERFTDQGPLALLPIANPATASGRAAYSLVWCASQQEVERRLQAPESGFVQELQRRFGRRVGFARVRNRLAFPLGMNWRSQLVEGKQVRIGNAAQILHPVAGQGLNLGLRDAWALSRLLAPPHNLQQALHQFQQERHSDRQAVLKATDWMVRGFGQSNPLVALGRQAGLNAMEYTPFLRQQFAQFMLFGWQG
ncbi:MAG: hypothetical protein HC848_06335 [Limnobacter sp.]|nr:hypothetical protein [Limnobacter sp.]